MRFLRGEPFSVTLTHSTLVGRMQIAGMLLLAGLRLIAFGRVVIEIDGGTLTDRGDASRWLDSRP